MSLWTAAHLAPLSMGVSRQDYWSGMPCPSAGDLPDPGTEPRSLASLALAGGLFTTVPPAESQGQTKGGSKREEVYLGSGRQSCSVRTRY